MDDKNPFTIYENKKDSDTNSNQTAPFPKKETGLFSTLLLIIWYLFLGAISVLVLGVSALFVVCMV